MTVTVRLAQQDDVPTIYRMLRESAAAQNGEEDLCVDPNSLREDGFGLAPPRFQCLLAELGRQPAGIALYYFTYSTWTSRTVAYLEDLYVTPGFRRQGVARLLMAELAKIAIGAGCLQVRWLVLRENASATGFYESIGAKLSREWSSMRIERENLKRLAKRV
jgi:GNAT superfamily N-acetyltransferase